MPDRVQTPIPWYTIHGYTPHRWHPATALYAPLYEWQEPSVILVNDMFAGGWIDQRRDRVFAVMALCPQHLFVLVTNYTRNAYIYLTTIDREPHFQTVHRICEAWPENAAVPNYGITFPLPNLWLGTRVETQAEADDRIPKLLATPAALQFVHVTPREEVSISRHAQRDRYYMTRREHCGWIGSSCIAVHWDNSTEEWMDCWNGYEYKQHDLVLFFPASLDPIRK